MIIPDSRFRPNPARAIYIQGIINQQLVDRLTPQIIQLHSQSREPITVYIDSPGGSVPSTDTIRRLLSAPTQDGSDRCSIVTVVTTRAASSAADLLSFGNYALAYPESTILYHGVRTSFDRPLTVEFTSILTENLKMTNDRQAMTLARESEWRIMFRYVSLRARFDEFRANAKQKSLTDLDCFLGLISDNISGSAKEIIEQAKNRHKRYGSLLDHVAAVSARFKSLTKRRRRAESEGITLKAIINFEVKSNKEDESWTFRDGGIARLSDDFSLLEEYMSSIRGEQFKRLCQRWGNLILSPDEKKELEGIHEENLRFEETVKKARPHFGPLWSFFVALCHVLQEGENELSSTDAFWLGLIDEVIGQGLPSLRMIQEFKPDPEPVSAPADVPQVAQVTA